MDPISLHYINPQIMYRYSSLYSTNSGGAVVATLAQGDASYFQTLTIPSLEEVTMKP